MATEAPLRLAFVYPQLKRLTGAQRLILQLASTLVQQGHAVTLVSHRLADECRRLLDPAVAVALTGWPVDWSGRHLIDSALEYLLGMALVARLPSGLDASLYFGPPSLPALAVAGRRTECRLAFCYEPPRFAYADRGLIAGRLGLARRPAELAFRLYRPLDRWLIAQADLICANGRFGAAEIMAIYGRPALVIDHGVALAPTAPAELALVEQDYGLADRPVLLTVNHLHPRKRLDLFLATLVEIRRRWPTALGLIVGVGADRPRLTALAERLGISEAVCWTGFVADERLPALYRRANIYLHTGQRETFGLSVLEAAAAGCPVVAVDEGGPRDILDGGRLGRLVAAEPKALALAVEELLGQPALAAALGRQAAAAVQARFRWENGAHALVAAIRRLQAGESASAIVGAVATDFCYNNLE